MTIAYFYLMKTKPIKILQAVEQHVQYWHDRALPDYRGGPFSDRSGGLILFSADDLCQAEQIIEKDPFNVNDLVAEKWIKIWEVA